MQRRIITTTLYTVALIVCMTSGWHTWPLCIGLGVALALHTAGYRITEDQLKLTEADLARLLNGR